MVAAKPTRAKGRPAVTAAHPTPVAAGEALGDVTRELNAWIELDLDALEHNIHALRSVIGPAVDLIAVVKANAYGHGLAAIAPALASIGVERFAVVSVAEALALRRLGVHGPVLVMGHAFPGDAAAAVSHDITLTIHSLELAKALAAEARAAGKVIPVHIKVDTGLHRFGAAPDDAIALAHAARNLDDVAVEGLWTHMANADEADDSFSERQHAVFEEVSAALPWIPYRHAANSATALRRPELRYNGVRVGLAMHGVVPPNTPDIGLRPVLTLKARLARVSTIEPGEGVSYGLTWQASRQSRIGLVPVGYGDGLLRALGNRGATLAGGHRVPMVGRMCMDHYVVDVTDVPGPVIEGTEVVIIGAQGDEQVTADELAGYAGTISWEVLSSLQARLPRVAHRGGTVERIIPPA